MKPQDESLVAAYGEAMLYSHLIEDMLKLNLREAARFRANGYVAPAKLPWRMKDIKLKKGSNVTGTNLRASTDVE